jgi:hypothetical protein
MGKLFWQASSLSGDFFVTFVELWRLARRLLVYVRVFTNYLRFLGLRADIIGLVKNDQRAFN